MALENPKEETQNLNRDNLPFSRSWVRINRILIDELIGEQTKVYGQGVCKYVFSLIVTIQGAWCWEEKHAN